MVKKIRLFNFFNDYFDKIYVITLKKSKDRHVHIHKTFKGLDYQIFWGVDGSQLELDELEKKGLYHPHLTRLLRKRIGRSPSGMSPGMIGCALSHVEIYKKIVENHDQRVLIFEDDSILQVEDMETVRKAFRELPDDWELLYLGHKGTNSNPSLLLKTQSTLLRYLSMFTHRYERLRSLDPDVIQRWFSRPYSENLELSGSHFGTHAYAVTAEGAEKILKYQIPVVQEPDNLLGELCSYGWIKAFNLKEQIFSQNEKFSSTIDPKK